MLQEWRDAGGAGIREAPPEGSSPSRFALASAWQHKTALAIRDARLGVLQPPTEKKKKQEEKQQEQQNGGAAEQPAGTIAGTDAGSDPAAAESGSSEAPGAEKDVVGVGSSREP